MFLEHIFSVQLLQQDVEKLNLNTSLTQKSSLTLVIQAGFLTLQKEQWGLTPPSTYYCSKCFKAN